MYWIRPKNSTRKSHRWECSACGEISYFVPVGKQQDEAECLYRLCPWCGEKAEKKRCGTCRRWAEDTEVCCNDKSEYRGDFTLGSDCCEQWEGKKDAD